MNDPMTSVPPAQPPAAPETDVRLTEAERDMLLVSAGKFDGDPSIPGLLMAVERIVAERIVAERIVAERVRVVEGERDAARAESRHARQTAAEYVTIALEVRARAESAEAAHAALVAAVEALADEWASSPDDRRYDGDRARALRALLAGGAR